jgi:Spy/CpxP family protein refolding chaperone
LHDPSADLAAVLPAFAAPDAIPQKQEDAYEVPAHLKDLDENELPENQRGLVLDQISLFRDQAAKREADRKKREEQMEQEKEARRYASAPQAGQGMPGRGPGGPGPSNMRTWGAQRAGPGFQEQSLKPIGNGPQSYNKPVGFVKSSDTALSDDLTDEQREELRVKEKKRRHDEELAEVRRPLSLRSSIAETNSVHV